ncbi:T-lymphocyte activation antigen CD80-like [Sceloporus undulatus]|uniref:T-lymphocyte activation antigen CD80-like n=1 Tax=Sceloporus undulatus TaxID=8520 RepID=UPI001C4BEBC7|nr:T-lymphocyte activation antigen CD80-like [Sceloporus undulatus]
MLSVEKEVDVLLRYFILEYDLCQINLKVWSREGTGQREQQELDILVLTEGRNICSVCKSFISGFCLLYSKEIVHTQKTEQMFSRSILMVILWLSLFVLQSDTSGKMMTVTAKVGDEAKLPCNSRIRPEDIHLPSHFIYWQKQVGNEDPDRVVISYAQGTEEHDRKHAHYGNRTKMNEKNFTLSISSVKVSDEGKYWCVILKNGKKGDGFINLSVVAHFSKPAIYAETPPNTCGPTQLTLNCSSYGGYPAPKMLVSINNVTVEWNYTVTFDNQTELYNVTGQMQINMTEDIFVQCLVVYAGFEESVNRTWSIQKQCALPLPPASPPPHGIILASSVVFIFLLAVLIVVLRQCACKHLRSSRPISAFQPVATIEMAPQQKLNRTSEEVSF